MSNQTKIMLEALELNNKFNSIRTKHGLLYQHDKEINLPNADWVAHEFGFMFAERLVKYLEKRK